MAPRASLPGMIGRAISSISSGFGFGANAAPLTLDDPRLWGGVSQMTTAGVNVTPDAALGLDVVQSVLSRLAGTISTMPLMVYERLEDAADADDDADALTSTNAPAPKVATADPRKVAKGHALWKLLRRRPNRRQTAQEFWAEFTFNLAAWRNAYAQIVPDDTTGHPIGQLVPIHPKRVLQIERRPANDPNGRVWYRIQSLVQGEWDIWLPEDQIFHVRLAPLRADGLAGIPVFESAKETIGRAIAVEQFGALYFANGGSGGGVLEHPGQFKSKEEQQNFLETWRNGGNGLNRHKDRLLLFGLKYTPFSVDNDEAQFIETLKEVSVKLCRLWNMPPHLVGILDRATFSNIEQQSIEYVVHTIAPLVGAIEQAVCRDLLIGEDQDKFFVEFKLDGLLRGDFKTRMGGYALGRQWGWLSANDIRALENMAPIGDAGDIYLTPLNMADANAPSDPEPDQHALPGPDDDEEDDAAPGKVPADPPAKPGAVVDQIALRRFKLFENRS